MKENLEVKEMAMEELKKLEICLEKLKVSPDNYTYIQLYSTLLAFNSQGLYRLVADICAVTLKQLI